MASKLTPSQQKVLDFLRQRMSDGVPPSVREICAATGIKSTSSVHNHLCVLEQEGYITRASGLNRSIRLADESPVVQVPLIGRVTAGSPVYAFEDVVAHIPFPSDRYQGSQLFALRVCGESMIGAGILDVDIIVAEKTPTAYNGEIVVAMIEDEATVKRLYRENDGLVRLQPENDLYEPIISDNVSVLGKVVSCIRYYG
ncbi:MAG: transcriptional repressor LexA [Clostridia bacterium]|nr:transcriptional repressor LexA [Clostridia bacterium]